MEFNNSETQNCILCENTEKLKSFKTVMVCESCIEYAKALEVDELLDECEE